MEILKVRQETDRTVIKINEDAYLTIKEYTIIKKVIRVMQEVCEFVPVPRVILYGESLKGIGYLFTEAIQSGGVVNTEGYMKILRGMRNVKSPDFGTVERYIAINLERTKRGICDESIGLFLDMLVSSEDWGRYSMCISHGDLHPENVISDAHGNLLAVIDWEYSDCAPEFMEEIIAWVYHPDIVPTNEEYSVTTKLLFVALHIFVFRPDLSERCRLLMNSQLVPQKDVLTRRPSGMDTVSHTLLVLLVSEVRGINPN